MVIVCAFFIARIAATFLAAVHVASICAGEFSKFPMNSQIPQFYFFHSGVLGYLNWWGVTLDPITMAFNIMAVGFSVDYAAHFCYHYATCTDRHKFIPLRLAETFEVTYSH